MPRFDVIIYCDSQMRRFCLPPLMDTNHTIFVPSVGTALKRDIPVHLNVAGGKWRVLEGEYVLPHHPMLKPGDATVLTVKDIKIIIYLRALDENITRYEKYFLLGHKDITIGNSEDTIFIKDDQPPQTWVTMTLTEGEALITPCANTPIFVNGTRIDKQHRLKDLDSLYIQDVHFVYMGSFLAVNQVNRCAFSQKLAVYENKMAVSSPSYTTDKSIAFQRSTQLRLAIVPEIETLDIPPTPKTQRLSPFILQAGASLSMFFVMAASLMVRITQGSSNQVTAIVSTLSLVGSLAGMVIFPMLLRNYNTARLKREEDERYESYHKYLLKMDKYLENLIKEDMQIWNNRYLKPMEILMLVHETKRELWGRAPVFQEFLDIRIGKGLRPSLHSAQIASEGFVINKDPCRQEADDLVRKYQYSTNAPLSVELAKDPIVGIFGHQGTCFALLHSMILQIVALHSYDDVKMIFLYDEDMTFIQFARWLPHVWNHERNFRFIVNSKHTLDDVLEHLQPLFDERAEKKEKQKSTEEVFLPHFIIISLSPALLKNEQLHRRFLSSYDDLYGMGVSFIIVDKNIGGMPLLSNTLIQCNSGREAYVYKNDGKSREMHLFEPDCIAESDWPSDLNWKVLARGLFRTRIMDISESNLLPQSLSFMGMYNAVELEDLHINERWEQNDCSRSILAPVGMATSNLFNLDIHEKGHGPHGLIAGTTGSGKSEFLQTLILSLCINYSPEDIAIIIIDYKGGSTANIFQNLPHLAGSITNLSGNQIQRSLTTIKSELHKRQRAFKECGDPSVNNIDKYNELRKSNRQLSSMPHLVLIADEFAELKKEQTAFMNELISISRIGRSLGVHLLLATQKPSGVVNDQIVSNTRFRICLKVADKVDSQELLKHPDAANITQSGRAYVQVGNDEIYLQIQSGYSGAPFFVGKKAGKEVAEILYIQPNGQINPNFSAQERLTVIEKSKTQLEVIVNHIKTTAEEEGKTLYRLWQDPLSPKIYMDTLSRKPGFPPHFSEGSWPAYQQWMAPVIGQLDDVKAQSQPLFSLNFAKDGHVVVLGIKGSGKTTLLQTLVYALATQYTPDDVHMYLVDYDVGALTYCAQLPHVGGVLLAGDDQRLKSLFILLEREAEERKKRLSERGFTDLGSYIQESGVKVPALVVMIHSFESFLEERSDAYLDKVRTLVRDGARYGIFFVLTGGTKTAVPSNIQRYIRSFLCMQMLEFMDYKIILNTKEDNVKPEPVSGRGLINRDQLMEFHIALAMETKTDNQRVTALREQYGAMKHAWTGRAATVLAAIPDPYLLMPSLAESAYQDMLHSGSLPIGYNTANNNLLGLRFTDIQVFPIIGGIKTGKTNLLKCLLRLCKEIPDATLFIFDTPEGNLHLTVEELKLTRNYAHDKASIITVANELKTLAVQRGDIWMKNPNTTFKPLLVFVDDIVQFYQEAALDDVMIIDGLIKKGIKYGFSFFITGQKIDVLKGQEGQTFRESLFVYEQGMLLGGNLENYSYFNTSMNYSLRTTQYPSGMGFIFNKGKYSIIKTPKYSET